MAKKHRATSAKARELFLSGATGADVRAAVSADAGAAAAAEAGAAEAESRAQSADPGAEAVAMSKRSGPDYSRPATIDIAADPVLHAMTLRRSISKVGPGTPSDADLRELIRTATSVADHKGLKPWRFLILRGDDRLRLGEALDAAADVHRAPGEINTKPLRAELLLALVASPTPNPKVPEWEQHATAAGAGHLLELALWQAGWGVMWRTGTLANSEPVRRLHRLKAHELLMGWLYIGSIPESYRTRLATSTRPLPDPTEFLDTL